MTYVLNPRLHFLLEVEALSKSLGRRKITFENEGQSAEFFKLAVHASANGGEIFDAAELDPGVLKQLIQVGLVVEENDVSPTVLFVNRLSELSSEAGPSTKGLSVNAKTWLDDGGDDLPNAVAKRIGARPEIFSRQWPMVWVQDAVKDFIHPIHLEAGEASIVAELLKTKSVSGLSASMSARLHRAGILIERRAVSQARKSHRLQIEACRKSLRKNEYAVMRQVLPEIFHEGLIRYLRAIDAAGYMDRSSDSIAFRHRFYQEPVNRFIHVQLNRVINEVVPEPVKPSYCYLATYHYRSELKRHTDRPQCEWNVSLQLDNRPTIPLNKAWPIHLEIGGKAREVTLDIGDAVLYSGVRIPHWRPPLPKGRETTLCFFHFVGKNFKGDLG